MRPGPREPGTPRLHGRSEHHRGLLALPVCCRDIDDVGVSVPCQPDRCARVVPTEVDACDLHPMAGDSERLDLDALLGDRVDPTAAEGWDALGSRFPLVGRIAVDDGLALL